MGEITSVIFTVVGFLGSIISITALFLNVGGWRAKLIHGIYAVVIFGLAVCAYLQDSRLSEIRNIEKAANRLSIVTENLTDAGAILAIMAFLEKVRPEFPDAYERAKVIYDKNDIGTATSHPDARGGAAELRHAWTKSEVAFALRGMLHGISASSK